MAAALSESLVQPNAVVIVEWSDIVENILPENRIQVVLKATSEDARVLQFKIPASYNYLEPVVQAFLANRSLA